MKGKEQLIQEFIDKPVKVGDVVIFRGEGNGSRDKNFPATANIIAISGDTLTLRRGTVKNEVVVSRSISEVTRLTSHIGYSPFAQELRVQSINRPLDGLLHSMGFGVETATFEKDKYILGALPCNTNPYLETEDGLKYYQRDLVWTDVQNSRLIDSIFNHVDIGKVVFKRNSYAWVESQVKLGRTAGFYDLVDGKQRLNAITEFIKGNVVSTGGYTWNDLSKNAQRKFLRYMNFSYAEMPEDSSNEDVLRVFLAINHLGVPQSEEHINFVKSLLNKAQ